ncbi:hypothetical protein [Bauldia litoralis]|uniref:hypothetical protein n=1 Tax=Bauldia litoralis TaxID=665467 RepID=UPI0032660097
MLRAVADGRLPRLADGSIDLALVGTAWRQGNEPETAGGLLLSLDGLAIALGKDRRRIENALAGRPPEAKLDAWRVSTVREALRHA